MAQDHSLKEQAVDPNHDLIRKPKSRPTKHPWGQDGAVLGSAQTPLPPGQSVAMGPSVVRSGNPISRSGPAKDVGGHGRICGAARRRMRVTVPAERQLSEEGGGAAEASSALINPQLFNVAHTRPSQLLGTILNVLCLAAFFTVLHARYTPYVLKN